MNSDLWQSAASLLVAALILSFISHEYSALILAVGMPSAAASSLIRSKERRYLRRIGLSPRRAGLAIFLALCLVCGAVSAALPPLAGPILSCLTISAFLPATFLPSISSAIAGSPEMRFRPRVESELLASVVVGILVALFYLGVNVLGVFSLIGG